MQYEISSGDCVIGAIIDPNMPATCLTKSVKFATNDDPGKRCVFPFTYNTITYNECIYEPGDVHPWCATELDANGLTVMYGIGGIYLHGNVNCCYSFCIMTTGQE